MTRLEAIRERLKDYGDMGDGRVVDDIRLLLDAVEAIRTYFVAKSHNHAADFRGPHQQHYAYERYLEAEDRLRAALSPLTAEVTP